MCWEVVSPLLMALGNGPYSVIYSHPCMPSSPCSAFWSNYYEKQYSKSHVSLLSNILRISEFYHCMYQTTTIKRKLHQTYILGVTFWFCLLQSITLIWPYLETSLKFLHKSMDFSFVEHKINYPKSLLWTRLIHLVELVSGLIYGGFFPS